MNGAISDIDCTGTWFSLFYLMSDEFSPRSVRSPILPDSVFYIGNEKLVKSLIPKFCFWMLSWSYSFVYFCFSRSTDVRISSSLFVVSIPDLHGVHCFRLSWTHAFDCEYIMSFRFCFMEVELDTQWSLRGMRAQRDGLPMKAECNPENFEFERLRACFKCPERGALGQWFLSRMVSLTGLKAGAEPDWGTSTMRCLSKWEREWYVLFLLGSACKCFLCDCQSIWSKVVCWCNDNDLFFFVSQVSDREQSVIWNETTLRIMLQRECIC